MRFDTVATRAYSTSGCSNMYAAHPEPTTSDTRADPYAYGLGALVPGECHTVRRASSGAPLR
jgi:hypothetical protein